MCLFLPTRKQIQSCRGSRFSFTQLPVFTKGNLDLDLGVPCMVSLQGVFLHHPLGFNWHPHTTTTTPSRTLPSVLGYSRFLFNVAVFLWLRSWRLLLDVFFCLSYAASRCGPTWGTLICWTFESFQFMANITNPSRLGSSGVLHDGAPASYSDTHLQPWTMVK